MNYLYDRNGKIRTFNLKKENIIGRGSLALVYKIENNKCLKTFYKDAYDYLIPNYEEIHMISKLNLSNFYKIYDFLFDSSEKFAGYTMEYYNKENIDLLSMPTYFILDNFISIHNSIIELTKNKINIYEMHDKNAIINRNSITIIDVDDYYFNNNISHEELLRINNHKLGVLFTSLFHRCLEDYYMYDYVKLREEYIIRYLSSKISAGDIAGLCRELEQYKYPIDYVKKHVRVR